MTAKIKTDNQTILAKCKIHSTLEDCDWLDIKNESDIDGLMSAALGFNDSYVKDMYLKDGKQYICFGISTSSDILFELDGNFETNLIVGYGNTVIGKYLPVINEASIFFHNDLVYWIEGGWEESEETADNDAEIVLNFDKSEDHYFCANRVKWKLIIL